MQKFCEATCLPAIWVIAVLELALFVFLLIRFIKTKSVLTLLIGCLTLGLFYDAFIIALGCAVDPTKTPFISRIRFISHGLLIPLLFPISSKALNFKKPWNIVIYVITGVLMVAGIAEAIATKLGPVTIGGLTRMASIKGETPAWAEGISRVLSFGTVIPLMIAGIVVWIKQKTPFLFLSGLLMFAFSAIGPAFKCSDYIFYLSMYGEILMVGFMTLYVIRKEKKEKQQA